MKIHHASYFPYLPLFYILEGVKVGYFCLLINCFHIIQNLEQALPAVVQIGFPADLSMLAITLTAPPHCSQVSISIPKTRLSLCAQVID